MAIISESIIENYRETLKKDPKSKVFAALADALRERKSFAEGESLARSGIQLHPEYTSGYVALGRILVEQKRMDEALPILKKAAELSPENLLAHELLAQAYVELRDVNQALKSHKRALFLNPKSEKAKKAIKKLETLSAAEFDEDLFQMSPLSKAVDQLEMRTNKASLSNELITNQDQRIERQLSLIDALIIRQELDTAESEIKKLMQFFPKHPEVLKRANLLKDEASIVTNLVNAQEIRPNLSKEKAAIDNQIQNLKRVLRRLQEPPHLS